MKICVLLLAVAAALASGQRITTIQLDGVQYFVSRMNPYSPELNYFLAYQYCRSLGLQLASFETKEKADTMTQYLKNAGYTKYDFWTSGNKLGTDMFLWMSSGLPFNATFDYMLRHAGNRAVDVPPGTEPQRVARESGDSGSADGCVAMIAPTLAWDAQDCTHVKDFICEQTRCYYYNYGSIPVSATQGNRRPYLTTTTSPTNDVDSDAETRKDNNETASEDVETEATEAEQQQQEEHQQVDEQQQPEEEQHHEEEASSNNGNDLEDEEAASTGSSDNERMPEDPVVGRLMTTAVTRDRTGSPGASESAASADQDAEEARAKDPRVTRPVDIPDITTLFTDGPSVQARKETAFDGLETHEIRSSSRANRPRPQLEHREMPDVLDYETSGGAVVAAASSETEAPDSALEDSHTVGPYDSVQEDYVNDQPDESAAAAAVASGGASPLQPAAQPAMNLEQQQQDEESSTFLPQAEPDYRYNMKWRSAGKVLDPPSN